MKRHPLQSTTGLRPIVGKSLSITLMTLLALPSAVFANRRGDASPRNAVKAMVVPSAPPNATIEVNTTGDGDNVNPSAGCDTDMINSGDQCSLRAAIQRANAVAGDDVIKINI